MPKLGHHWPDPCLGMSDLLGRVSFQLGERCPLGFRVCLECDQPPPRVGYTELKAHLWGRGLAKTRQGIGFSTQQVKNQGLGREEKSGTPEADAPFYALAT